MEGDRLPRIARRALKMRTPDIFRPALKKYPVLRKGFSRYYAPLTLVPAEGQTAGRFRPAAGFAVEIRDRAARFT